MRQSTFFFVLSACAVTGTLLAAPANAYVRTRTATGCSPVFWAQSCIFMQPDSTLVDDMKPADIERIIPAAMASWTSRTGGGFLKLHYLPPAGPKKAVFDGIPVIKFRTNSWCHEDTDPNGTPVCYSPAATALTTLTYVSQPDDKTMDGKILDADIELNSVYHHFYDADQPAPRVTDGRPLVDLWNTLSHELGHVQGFDHTCRRNPDPLSACTTDDKGAPLPLCSEVEAHHLGSAALQQIYDTTMYPVSAAMEVSKRTPKADDIAGVVKTYPLSSDPMLCSMPMNLDEGGSNSTGGGCTAAPQRPVGGATWLLPLLLAAAYLRRLRRFWV